MSATGNITPASPGLQRAPVDLTEMRHALSAPKGLGAFERYHLWRRGRKDARRRSVQVTGNGTLSSPFLDQLASQANINIIEEWNRCNAIAFDLRTQLEQTDIRRQTLLDERDQLENKRELELAHVRERQHVGDTVVSEYLVTKRQERREAPVLQKYQDEHDRITRELEQLEMSTIPIREQMRNVHNIAQLHEQAHRNHYLWKMAAYAYGASRYVHISPAMINDAALSTHPAEDHLNLFGEQLDHVQEQSPDEPQP